MAAPAFAESPNFREFQYSTVGGAVIGSGYFGIVYKGVHAATNALVAVKKANVGQAMRWDGGVSILEHLQCEYPILTRMSHENILHCFAYNIAPVEITLVLEYCNEGDLAVLIQNCEYPNRYRLLEDRRHALFSEMQLRRIFGGLASGLNYLHSAGICHRNLKPENVLLQRTPDNRLVAKISGFGLSKNFGSEAIGTTQMGTLVFRAPEMLADEPYSNSVDLWSMGLTLFETLVGILPFPLNAISDQHSLCSWIESAMPILHLPETIPSTPQLRSLIAGLLTVDPDIRLTAAQFLCHPWFSSSEEPSGNNASDPMQVDATHLNDPKFFWTNHVHLFKGSVTWTDFIARFASQVPEFSQTQLESIGVLFPRAFGTADTIDFVDFARVSEWFGPFWHPEPLAALLSLLQQPWFHADIHTGRHAESLLVSERLTSPGKIAFLFRPSFSDPKLEPFTFSRDTSSGPLHTRFLRLPSGVLRYHFQTTLLEFATLPEFIPHLVPSALFVNCSR